MDEATIKKFFKLEIDDAILVLVTIVHPQIEPIRVVNNLSVESGAGNIISRGETYIAYPFNLDLPANTDDSPRATLTIANVDRRISDAINNLDSSPIISFEIVAASEPDNVIIRFPRFELVDVTWNAVSISGELIQASYASEPFGFVRVTPGLFPALFRT